MKKVTANQPFYGTRDEQMWNTSDTKEVSDERAAQLLKEGLVDEPEDHAKKLAAQNKILNGAADKSVADQAKKQKEDLEKAQRQAELDKAKREKDEADRRQKEAKEAAERKTKEEKEANATKAE